MRLRLPVLVAIALTAILLSAACGGEAEQPGGGLEHDVHVHLDEWSVEVDSAALGGPGSVTFGGHNHGSLPHQLTVIRTDLDPAELPLDRVSVDVDAAGEEVLSFDVPAAEADEGLQVGIAELEAGKYAIICNIPGHYQQGMYASLEVTETPGS